MPVEVGDKDVPTYPVSNCNGLHRMTRSQGRRQSDVEMRDEIIVLFVFRSTIATGSTLGRRFGRRVLIVMLCNYRGEVFPDVSPVIEERGPVPVMGLRDANRFPPNNLMLCDSDRSCALGGDRLGRKPDGLIDRGRDGEDFDSFGNRDKLDECCEGIPGSPCLVREEDAVH